MKKHLKKIGFLAVLFLVAAFVLGSNTQAATKKKGAAKKEASGVVTAREKKLLAWKNDWPDSYAIHNPDFFVRGALVDYKQIPNSKEWEVTLLPLEVVENPNHYITMDHFKNGLTFKTELNPNEIKQAKKGGVVEYNHYSKEIPGEAQGHARLVSTEIHSEFKPYDAPPVAYLTKPGMEPEQINNAIKGALLYSGNINKDDKLKNSLASHTKNPATAENAKSLSSKLFGN